MQTPLEIAFHNLQPSPAIETEIRERVAKLGERYTSHYHPLRVGSARWRNLGSAGLM